MVSFLSLILFLSNLLNYLDRQLFSALFPVLTSAFRLGDMEVGLLGSAFTFSYLFSAPLIGLLSDRLNFRNILGMGILVFSLGMAICAVSSSVQGLFLGRMLTGTGEAALLVVGPQMLGMQDRTGFRMGFFLCAMPIGSAIGFAMAIGSESHSFRTILSLPVLPGLLLGSLFFLLSFRFPSKKPVITSIRTVGSIFFRNRILLSIVGAQISNAFVLGGMAIWISLYMTREKHLTVAAGSKLTGLALVIGGSLGMILSGILCDRIDTANRHGICRLIQTGQIISLSGIFIVLYGHSGPVLFLGLCLASIGLFGVNVPLTVALMRMSDFSVWGLVLGSSLLLTHLFGDLPSSSLIGLLSSRIGLSGALSVLLPGTAFIGLFVLWRAMRSLSTRNPLDFQT